MKRQDKGNFKSKLNFASASAVIVMWEQVKVCMLENVVQWADRIEK